MEKNLAPEIQDLKTKNETSDSYFNTSDEDNPNQNFNSKASTDYFNISFDSENEYKTRKPEIIYKTETTHYGRFDEIIGNGSYKKVYKGYDYNEGREIAWYEIDISDSEENNLNKIKEEMLIMKNLKHPNIIKYYNGWLDLNKKKVIMITEFFTGGTLKSHLKIIKPPPRLRVIKKWIKEILEGLNYLHSKDIIHRDIKCDNFFFDKINGNVKIGDLGESQFLKGYKFLSKFIGTTGFIAPEVHEGKYNNKADIYSLGMSIIEMLTLETPYKEYDGILQIYEKEKNNIYPESLFKINNINVVNFIKLCLKKENQRPNAKELLNNFWLNDDSNDENNFPVFIKDSLRLNAFKIDFEKKRKSENNGNINIYNINSFSHRIMESKKNIKQQFSFSPKNIRGQSYENNKITNDKNNFFNQRNSSVLTESTIDSNNNIIKFKKSNTSFKIDINDYDNKEGKNNEIQIQFLIGKSEWKNKSKIIFNLFN